MAKSLNLLLQDFEEGLVDYINNSPLPIKAKILCIKDVLPEMVQGNTQSITRERAKLKAEEEKEGAKDGEEICKD